MGSFTHIKMGSFFAKLPIRNKYLFLIFVSELKRSNSKQNGNNKFFQIAANNDRYFCSGSVDFIVLQQSK